jgi:hypothetical protein
VLKDVVAKGIRVVSNAGGVNPRGLRRRTAPRWRPSWACVKIATVTGDDVMPLMPALREQQPPVGELQSGAPLPAKVLTANAYLGALPVKAALDAGAQIVITGRCVDSAVTLGVLMHEFGWDAQRRTRRAGRRQPGRPHHRMRLPGHGRAAHRLAGPCPTGPHIGYPIVECRATAASPSPSRQGTGGLVTPQTVAEQMLYEIGDPANYLLPDVVCDFTGVTHRTRRASSACACTARAVARPPAATRSAPPTWMASRPRRS